MDINLNIEKEIIFIKGVSATDKFLSLKPGQTIQAKIISVSGNEAILKIGDSRIVAAINNLELEPGILASFMVVEASSNRISLKLLSKADKYDNNTKVINKTEIIKFLIELIGNDKLGLIGNLSKSEKILDELKLKLRSAILKTITSSGFPENDKQQNIEGKVLNLSMPLRIAENETKADLRIFISNKEKHSDKNTSSKYYSRFFAVDVSLDMPTIGKTSAFVELQKNALNQSDLIKVQLKFENKIVAEEAKKCVGELVSSIRPIGCKIDEVSIVGFEEEKSKSRIIIVNDEASMNLFENSNNHKDMHNRKKEIDYYG